MNKGTGTGVAAILALTLALAGAPLAAKAAGKRFHTVLREPVEKVCVVNLTAPRRKAGCRLDAGAPPARLVVEGWYRVGWSEVPDGDLQKFAVKLNHKMKSGDWAYVRRVMGALRRFPFEPLKAWHARKIEAPGMLNPPPGGRKWWEGYAYTEDQLESATLHFFDWMSFKAYPYLKDLEQKKNRAHPAGRNHASSLRKRKKPKGRSDESLLPTVL